MKLGCGLFGLAFDLENNFEKTLQNLGENGFTAVEPLYAFPNDPALAPDSPVPSFLKTILWDEEKVQSLLPKLKEWGLTISSMHVDLAFGVNIDEALPELISFSEKTGIRYFMTSLEFDTLEKCKSAADLLNHANQILNPHNIYLGYHNHYTEFKKIIIDGTECTLMEYFLSHTAPEVKLQLDTGWQMYSGDDVIAFIQKYADRIFSVHLKDFVSGYDSIEKDDAFAATGYGVLPTKEILAEFPNLNLFEHGLMIDQDHAAKNHSLPDDLKAGAAYLKELIG
ncbi:MAG: sugar phosphate isomerase/epimerase [Lachnospiraceae bacterium]|nr:sugar phosphate isomerase/epimerase [Lachnospiraceae bacterium]